MARAWHHGTCGRMISRVRQPCASCIKPNRDNSAVDILKPLGGGQKVGFTLGPGRKDKKLARFVARHNGGETARAAYFCRRDPRRASCSLILKSLYTIFASSRRRLSLSPPARGLTCRAKSWSRARAGAPEARDRGTTRRPGGTWAAARLQRKNASPDLCCGVFASGWPVWETRGPHNLRDNLGFVWSRRPVLEDKNTKAPTLVLLRAS